MINSGPALLPLPKGIDLNNGFSRIDPATRASIACPDRRIEAAWDRLVSAISNDTEHSKRVPAAAVRVAASPSALRHPEAYRLRISRETVEIHARESVGCFRGLATLGQLIDPEGRVPLGEVLDEPDYSTRGVLHDVTRGKCPKLGTLKLLADRLAALKVNQLQLYIEHSFTFGFDREICGPDEGLTPDEIRELDAYCRERFIDLVPAVATLGHMGRVLSMPKYRHLAEIEAVQPWEQMGWLRRMRGFTLDVLNPQSRELVSRIWSDVLDAFSSPMVNICGDEPWDLGRGKNADRLDAVTRGEAYVDHIAWTHDLCAARGRTTQLWSDVVRNYPHLLRNLPRDLTVLHWGYDDKADYDGTRTFVDSGLETIICPGTSGWKRIINAMDLAERNILTFARAGLRHGARGFLNTDWGDYGHFNQLACAWHGIALGAAAGWNAEEPGGGFFDARFAEWIGMEAAAVGSLRQASSLGEFADTWRLMALPDDGLRQEKRLPTLDECEKAAAAAEQFREATSAAPNAGSELERDRRELAVACRFTEVFAERIRRLLSRSDTASADSSEFSEGIRHATADFANCWDARNKPLRLADITDKLAALATS